MRLFQENLFLVPKGILSKMARAWPTPPPPAAAQRATSFPTTRASVCSFPATTNTACTFFSSSSDEHLSKRGQIRVSTLGCRFSAAAAEDEDDAAVAEVVAVLTQQKRRSRWGFLRSMLGTSAITSEQAAKITIRLKSNPRLALRFFQWSQASSLCRHDLSSYAAMIHVLARGRLRSAALSLIRSAILLGDPQPEKVFQALVRSYRACDSTPLAFDLLVRACLQARRFDQALEIIRKLRNRDIFPAISTCNDLIGKISATRGASAGIAIYEELFNAGRRISPNVQTFNALLLALNRDGRREEGEKIRRSEMERHACKPNCFTYSVLMAGLYERGEIQAADDLFREMAAAGIEPDAAAYDAVIGGLCAAGEMARAGELFRDMAAEGIEPTGTSYERLIAGHCANGDVSAAGDLFEEMLKRGFRPETSTVGKMVGKLCEERRVVDGLSLLRREMERGGGLFVPSREIFQSLIEGFCREGEVEEALKLQAEMAGKGFEPDLEICRAFLDEYLRRGDLQSARKLHNEMLGRGLAALGRGEDEIKRRILGDV